MLNDYYNDHELNELAKSESPQLRKLVAQHRELGRSALLSYMAILGSKYLGDGAHPALGRVLYKALLEGPKQLTEEEVGELAQMSQIAGGFWDTDPEPEFKTFEEWRGA